MWTFDDIFKSSFLERMDSVSLFDMGVAMVLAFGLGLFIFLVYKRTYAGVMYSASFGVTLVALCMITAMLILAVTSNIVLSLGMVGALSIVRFRTAIKEPSDIAFLFWSIGAGIVLAAGLIPLAVFGSVLIGGMLLAFSSQRTLDQPYILVVHCDTGATEAQVLDLVKRHCKKTALKSKTITPDGIELNYEVRPKGEQTEFVNTLAGMLGVRHVVMVSYNGDYMS